MFYIMGLVEGRTFWNGALPDIARPERRVLYAAMIETLARLPGLDPAAVNEGASILEKRIAARASDIEVMTRNRLTREDSRERTTQRLLAAAQKLIAKKGLSATTLEDIAEEAGYTRGAFYSNFAGKHDLFIELLRRDQVQTLAQLPPLRDDSLPIDVILKRAREFLGRSYRTNEAFMVWTEARLLAARDAKFRAKFKAMLTEERAQIDTVVEYLFQRLGTTPPLPAPAIVMGLTSLFEGLRLSMLSAAPPRPLSCKLRKA